MQKLVGTELYVFDLTPFEITQQTSDATVIFVQNECIDGYKELNTSLADKIKGFNQFTICVTDPWAGGVEPGPEPPAPTGHTLTFGNCEQLGGIGYITSDPSLEDLDNITRIGFDANSQATIEGTSDIALIEPGKYVVIPVIMYPNSSYTITGVDVEWASSLILGIHYFYFVMPDQDVNIDVTCVQPINITFVNVDGPDDELKFNSDYFWYDEGVYGPGAFFVVDCPSGKSVTDYTYDNGGADIEITPLVDHFDVVCNEGGTVTFNAAATGNSISYSVDGIKLIRSTSELNSDADEVNYLSTPAQNVPAGSYVKLFTDSFGGDHSEYYTVSCEGQSSIQCTFVDSANSYNELPFFYFVMPDEDVTLSVTYNPPTVEVTYDVQDTESEIELFSAGGGSPYEGTPTPPDEMYVDGIQETVVNSWRFDSTGDHIVKFVFHSGRVSAGFMQNNQNAKSINLNEQVTQIGEYAFSDVQEPPLISIISLAATPPALGPNENPFSTTVPIYVPADYVTDYETAWSTYASQIQAIQS